MKLTKQIFQYQLFSVIIALSIGAIVYSVTMSILTHFLVKPVSSGMITQSVQRQQLLNELAIQLDQHSLEAINNVMFLDAVTSNLRQVDGEYVLLQFGAPIASSIELSRSELNTVERLMKRDDASFKLGKQKYTLDSFQIAKSQATFVMLLPVEDVSIVTWLPITLTLLSFLLVYLLISSWIARTVSREIVKPIEQLRQSALQISEGQLDSIIVEEGTGELLELCRALEQMRVKLKESVYLQQKFDDNRSFLISSISHDLRTPVTSIKGYIEGIIDGVANTEEKQKQYLLTAHRKTELMNSMIDDLLLFSKLDMKQLPFHLREINVIAYIEDCMTEHETLFQERGVKTSLQLEQINVRTVQIDPERFMRVLQNIIDNALLYNDKEQPCIDFMLRETYSSIVLEIKDNGNGMKEDDAQHIFDRFYRTDPARKVESGSGLGLAIAKQIVEAHHGFIWAKSKLGIGTSIFISLPKQRKVKKDD